MGDGGDGRGRAWVLEVILQVIVRAGKVPPRRAFLMVDGAEAPDCVGCHMRAHGGGLRACDPSVRALFRVVVPIFVFDCLEF